MDEAAQASPLGHLRENRSKNRALWQNSGRVPSFVGEPKVSKLRFSALAAMAFSTFSCAEGLGLSANVSSMGLGLDLTKGLSDGWTGRLGLDAYNYNKALNKSNIDYDADFKWQSVHALADWYPMRGTFRTSIGLVYNSNKFSITGKPSAGTYDINGRTYQASDVGSLSGEVTFNKSSPYIGVGWGNPVERSKSWGLVADLGVLYQGSPHASLTATCGAGIPTITCTGLTTDTAAQQIKLTSDLNSFKWYPVFSIGASYQF
jgi:hypothetical protein